MLLTAARLSKVLQLTLAVIKPDAVAHPLMMEALHQKILENNFVIVRCRDLVWRKRDSERFYAEHSGRATVVLGPMRAYILAREDAIRHWRELMGPTKVFRARYTSPDSIRGHALPLCRFSRVSPKRNQLLLPDFSVEEWMQKEEPSFRSGQIHYDQRNHIHTLTAPS
uniref:Nucleoside diphosphate kinase B n=1 Tax=Salarias fasciatus TaxID=181472 RepID=A0A672FJ82_SALFA